MNIVQKGVETCIRAAIAAGRELTARYDLSFRVEEKESLRDIVVDADRAAEDRAISVVSAADVRASILSEEAGVLGDPDAEYRWIIDALDGTVNYVHQIPLFSVSVALFRGEAPIAGAIFAPVPNDLYYAGSGLGAYKNDRGIRVIDRALKSSLFAVAFSGRGSSVAQRSAEFRLFQAVNDASRGCLRTGSAALNLAYLSEGRFNGCWGRANKLWDVAAGLVIAGEAGAVIRAASTSQPSNLIDYLAGTPRNADELKAFITGHVSEERGGLDARRG